MPAQAPTPPEGFTMHSSVPLDREPGLLSDDPAMGIGYAAGAGSAVTQITNATTGVVLATPTGQITTVAQNIAAAGNVQFIVTCTSCGATDVPNIVVASGTVGGTTTARCTLVSAGSFKVMLKNDHASVAETGTLVLNYALLKGVIA